jgi:hypothetical protein
MSSGVSWRIWVGVSSVEPGLSWFVCNDPSPTPLLSSPHTHTTPPGVGAVVLRR